MRARLTAIPLGLVLLLGLATVAGAQALPTTAVVGSPTIAGTPTTTVGCGGCVVAQVGAIPGMVTTSPYAGTITQWTVNTSGSGAVALLTLRPRPGGTYLIAANTPAQAVGPGAQTYQFAANLPVQPGDLVAVQTAGGATVIATTGTGGSFASGSSSGSSATLTAGQNGTLAVGAVVTRTPIVSGLTPSTGSTAGGTAVTIAGQNLDTVTRVLFGSTPATSFTINGFTSITAVAPAAVGAGNALVTVSGSTGASAGVPFAYTAAPAPPLPPPPAPPAPPEPQPRCEVPDLDGRTLRGARRALRRANCRLGEVDRAAPRRGRRARRVVRQSPRPGASRREDARVNVRLGFGRG